LERKGRESRKASDPTGFLCDLCALCVRRRLQVPLIRRIHATSSATRRTTTHGRRLPRLLALAAERPVPTPADLPAYFTGDHSGLARAIVRTFGAELDILNSKF
jgi:hypothetical protein